MANITQTLRRGLWAEALKLKHTWAWWLAVLAPLSVVAMNVLVFYFKGEQLLKAGQDPWPTWTANNFNITATLLLPLFLALLNALVLGTEHASQGWKQIYSAAVPKWSVFMTKYLLVLGLVLMAFAAFFGGLLAAGYVLGWAKPGLGFQHFQHVYLIGQGVCRIFISSLFIFSLQFCLCYRFKSIGLTIGLGILFTLAFLIGARWEHIGWYPYSWPYFAALDYLTPSTSTSFFTPKMGYSLAGSVILASLGLWSSVKRQII